MDTRHVALARALTDALDLALPPVAVPLADAVPDGVPVYRGHAPAGCAFWQEALKGPFATSPSDHGRCAVGMYTHNLARSPGEHAELGAALAIFAALGYVRAEDVPHIPVLPKQHRHVVYAPLASTPLPPDVVLLFVKPSQQLLLAEAVEQVDGRFTPAMGRPACAIVPASANTGSPALSLGCCGARAYVDALADDTALYALPGAKLDAYAERLSVLAEANRKLSRFHQIRRKDVEAGRNPTIADSLAQLQKQG